MTKTIRHKTTTTTTTTITTNFDFCLMCQFYGATLDRPGRP